MNFCEVLQLRNSILKQRKSKIRLNRREHIVAKAAENAKFTVVRYCVDETYSVRIDNLKWWQMYVIARWLEELEPSNFIAKRYCVDDVFSLHIDDLEEWRMDIINNYLNSIKPGWIDELRQNFSPTKMP